MEYTQDSHEPSLSDETNFIAYHKIAVWGKYERDPNLEFRHYTRHRLKKAIGQNVWVVSGKRADGRMIYKLCAVFQPSRIEDKPGGGFYLVGQGTEFGPHVDLTSFYWLRTLLKEQSNFKYGLNPISNRDIVNGLESIGRSQSPPFMSADEIHDNGKLPEGSKKQVMVNAYERNPEARDRCIEKYGWKCTVCNFDFEAQYGDLGKKFIHVHHLVPLSSIGEEYEVDPINDLRPVCPNCHAMIHRTDPPPFQLETILTRVKWKFVD